MQTTQISPAPRNVEELLDEAPSLTVRSELIVGFDVGNSRIVDVSSSEGENGQAETGEGAIGFVESIGELAFEGWSVEKLLISARRDK